MVEPTEAKPKDALALIFGILAIFIVLMFAFQLRDVSSAEAAEAGTGRVAPERIDNPATLDDATLWCAMAVRPIDRDAVRARREIWATTRQSIHTGMLVCALIFLAVPPIYLFDTFVPLIVGAPLIAGIGLWKSSRLLASGGDLDQAYARASRAMAPLGLRVVEHPEVRIEAKSAATFRVGPAMHGALVLDGERHGRHVSVRMPADGMVRTPSEVRVAAVAPAFSFRTRDGRLRAEKDAPQPIAATLKGVPNSTRWNGVRGRAEDGALVVERKSAKGSDWMLDLWLAERLTRALASR